jgi:hypothetical protein
MIRRINFFAGPGGGKSTQSARMFADMKAEGMPAEFVPEYIKRWAYLGHSPKGFDQYFVTAQQMHSEDIVLRSIPEAIAVCECPLFLGVCYAAKYKVPGWRILGDMAMEFEAAYPSLNILLVRGSLPYKDKARFEKRSEALEMDRHILNMLGGWHVDFYKFPYDDYDGIKALAYAEILKKKPLR